LHTTAADHKTFPYFVDENLKKKKLQPKWIKKTEFYKRDMLDPTHYQSGDKKEDGFRCRRFLNSSFDGRDDTTYVHTYLHSA
jgi:hypothetical protein